jgi:MFS family permease
VSRAARTIHLDKPWGGLTALCITQTVGYGLLYYSLLVAVEPISEQTGWSSAIITTAFSAGLVASALVGIVVGRMLDRRGPRVLMTVGSAIGVLGLVLVALAPNLWVFFLAWIVAGIGQATTLYQPAFAVITRWYGEDRVRPLTVVTLVAGFASTIFAPLVAGLLDSLDWRQTYLVLAGILAVTTVPLHFFFLNHSWAPRPQQDARAVPQQSVREIVRSRRFISLEIVMLLVELSLYTVTLSAIPLFLERGMDYGTAAVTFGLLGAGQVLGRLAFGLLPRGSAPWTKTLVIAAGGVLCLVLYAAVPGPSWLLVVVSLLAGGVRGCLTLLQATSVADRWGTANFGTLNGIFSAPLTAAGAITPALGPLLAGALGGYPAMAVAMAVVSAAALLLVKNT